MPGIIDSFVVALGWDTSEYDAGRRRVDNDQKKVREDSLRNAKEIENQARKVSQALDLVRREALRMLTVFTAGAGLQEFLSSTIKADAQVGRLAKQIGTSTEELSAWQGVLKRNGGTAEDATSALQGLTRAFEEIQLTGNSDKIPYLQTLGISLRDLKEPSKVLLDLADRFSRMDPRRAEALGRGLGLSPAVISTLLQGRQAVARMLEEQRRLGVVTERDALAAQRLQDAFESLKAGQERLGRSLLVTLAPTIEAVTRLLQDLAVWAQKNGPIVTGVVLGLATAFGVLALSMLPVTAPMLALVAAAAAVGAALGWLAQHIDEFPELQGAVDALAQALGEAGQAFRNAVEAVPPEVWRAIGGVLRDSVLGVVHDLTAGLNAIAGLIRTIAALLRGDFKGAWQEAKKTADGVFDGWKTKVQDAVNLFHNAKRALTGEPPLPSTPQDQQAARAVNNAAGDATDLALKTIRKFESYRAGAYYDVNAYRAGYGSDTITDPRTGRVSKVEARSRVTKEQAEADLRRRVTQEFTPKVQKAVGPAWNGLDASTKAALVSTAYNYGSLPNSVAAAARTGNRQAIADAIAARGADNNGVNAGRRAQEAAMVRGAVVAPRPAVPAPAQVAANNVRPTTANDNRSTTVTISNLNIQTQATDATGIARTIVPAVKREADLATQANTGLR